MKKFKLSDVQARAILEMPLRRLAALERKKIEEEYKELVALIKELEALLKSPVKMRKVIEQELQAMKAAYGDRRRTQIVSLKEGEAAVDRLTATDVTPAQVVWVGVTPDGLIGAHQQR
jgi:DNA gyrase subunit A